MARRGSKALLEHERCPDRANHTPAPRGYLEWHAWAEEKAKTHEQVQCPTCGLFAIWVPREERNR